MAQFLADHPEYVSGKTVLELAAGLGLPSLLASRWAASVISSDHLPEAVKVIQQSVLQNGLDNVQCQVLDWHSLPPELTVEVLLLSDINYDPTQFDVLYQLVVNFLEKGTLVLLTTPQRLMAKPFMERLTPLAISCLEIVVPHHGEQVPVTVLVLKR
jgi:predicted nicotinamide N-methyase